MEYTEQSIQRVLNQHYLARAKYIVNNLFIFGWESDYLAMTLSGYWYEVEIKITLSDFKADFKNKREKHYILGSQLGTDRRGRIKPRPHFFSYAVPEEMVQKVLPMIPDYAGLVGIHDNGMLHLVKSPVLIHKHKYTEAELRLTDKFYYNFISYKDKYNDFSKEIAKYRSEINFLKDEFKAVTGQSWKEYLKDARQ